VTVHYEERGHIALITIDRPERRGAMDMASYTQLANAWRAVASTPAIRVAVITGVGDSYCAGADLKDFIPEVAKSIKARMDGEEVDDTQMPASGDDDIPDGQLAVLRDVDFPKPIIAAVNGPCVASGMEMLLGIDIRFASPDAVFGLPEVKRGLFASGGSTVRLPRQIPFAWAMDILLTGRYLTAEEALRIGLINRIVEKPELLAEALAFAEQIAACSPTAVSATKRSVLDGLKVGTHDAFALELQYGDIVFSGPDAVEGPRAFLEKRAPEWADLAPA
jgi:enoyl-CoA hydratase